MKQKIIIAMLSIAVIGVIANFLLHNVTKTGITESGTGLEVGDLPPQFTLVNAQDENVQLQHYEGKKVILNFWASWCLPCRNEMPLFQEISERHEDVVVVAVNMSHKDSSRAKVDAFIQSYQLTFPIVFDEEGDVSKAYAIINIPSTYFLDESGVIQAKVEGEVNAQMVEKYLNEM